MDALNILLVGNNGSGKTSLLYATIREYYNLKEIPISNVLLINNLKEQGISYYRSEVKTFVKHLLLSLIKNLSYLMILILSTNRANKYPEIVLISIVILFIFSFM